MQYNASIGWSLPTGIVPQVREVIVAPDGYQCVFEDGEASTSSDSGICNALSESVRHELDDAFKEYQELTGAQLTIPKPSSEFLESLNNSRNASQ